MGFRHIVVGVDFSACSREALRAAVKLAHDAGAALTVAHVFHVPSYAYDAGLPSTAVDLLTPLREAAEQCLAEALDEARATLPGAASALRMGLPAEELVALGSELGADLIVVGTHGRHGLSHLVLGSVAERIVRTSPVSVLTVRAKSS